MKSSGLRRGRVAVIAAVLGVFVQGVRAEQPLGVGPVHLGMSLEEIQAATPGAGWRNVLVSPFSSRVFAVRTTSPVEIAGLRLHAYAEVQYYQRLIQLDAAFEAADAEQCELTTLEWLARFEAQSGPFEGAAPRIIPGRPGGIEWRVQSSKSGSVSLAPAPGIGTPDRIEGERVSFGQSSTALVDAYDEKFRPRARRSLLGGQPAHFTLATSRNLPDQSLAATVTFGVPDAVDRVSGRDQADPQAPRANCAIRVSLQRSIAPPPPQPFDAGRHPQVAPLSLAERHLAYPTDAEEFTQPIDVDFLCDVSRQTGLVMGCQLLSPAGLPRPLEEAAYRMYRSLQFDMRGVDRDDPQALRGPIRVRLEPGDRQPLDFTGAVRTPRDDVVWAASPAAGEILDTAGPLLGTESRANPVSVELACRVLADGSLLCVGTANDPTYFRNTAVRLAAAHYRAAPTLRDGSPSAGRVIDLSLQFRPSL